MARAAVPEAPVEAPVSGRRPGRTTTQTRISPAVVREIQEAQASTALEIPKAAFQRLVREIVEQCQPQAAGLKSAGCVKIRAAAITALQEAAEAHLVTWFTDAALGPFHQNLTPVRTELQVRDMELVNQIRKHSVYPYVPNPVG